MIICLSFCCCLCCLFQGSIELWTSKLLAADLRSAKSQLDGQEAQLDYVLVTGAEAVLLPYMGWGLRRQKGIGFKEWLQLVKSSATHRLGWSLGCWTFGHVGIRHDSDSRPTRPKEETNRLFCRSRFVGHSFALPRYLFQIQPGTHSVTSAWEPRKCVEAFERVTLIQLESLLKSLLQIAASSGTY